MCRIGSSDGEAGSTLIEALVAVAIISMAATIGFPSLRQGFVTLSQHQAVATVVARLRQARAQALRHDGLTTFDVAADGRSYAAGGVVTTAPPGVTFAAAGDGPIAFYGDGSSSGGRVWVIAGPKIAVTVAPLSGAVAVGS